MTIKSDENDNQKWWKWQLKVIKMTVKSDKDDN